MNFLKGSFIYIVVLFLAGFSAVQASALESESDSDETLKWEILANVHWVWEDGYYQAQFTDRQKELDGQEIVVQGFMFPLEYTRKHRNFLVSASPMGMCFFCGPGEAESMVYVKSVEDVEQSNGTMKVKGTFKLVTDPSQGIIYQLDNARVVK